MSELTPCCRCVLEDIKRDADAAGEVVTLLPGDHEVAGHRGTDVLVHRADEEPDRKEHWVAWMMEISDHCAC